LEFIPLGVFSMLFRLTESLREMQWLPLTDWQQERNRLLVRLKGTMQHTRVASVS